MSIPFETKEDVHQLRDVFQKHATLPTEWSREDGNALFTQLVRQNNAELLTVLLLPNVAPKDAPDGDVLETVILCDTSIEANTESDTFFNDHAQAHPFASEPVILDGYSARVIGYEEGNQGVYTVILWKD